MKLKSQKDFFSGLMFLGIGIAFAWGATTYNIGVGARMGPGYFPLMLGILLSAIGAFTIFESLVVETEDGEPIGSIAWRPLFFIIGANVAFGVLLGGIPKIGLPAAGLVLAITVLVATASMAESHEKPGEVWMGAVLGLALGTLVVAVVARYLVIFLEPGPYLAVRTAADSPILVKAWLYFAHFGGRIISFGVVAWLFHKYVPVSKRVKEYAFLTMTLIALSVWSFISLLNLQFQVWPTFITG